MKRLPLENDHLQAARCCYRSELPVASPFCTRCPKEGAAAGMLFPLSVECREAINAWYAGKSIPLKVAAVQHATTEAGGSNFELCMVVCCRASKQGIQFKGRSHRFCMSGCCWNHALVWACPSPLPRGGVVATGGCASCWHKCSDSSESKALAPLELDATSDTWKVAQAAWDSMWAPLGSEPFSLQELLGAPEKPEEVGTPDMEPVQLLQDRLESHAAKTEPSQTKEERKPARTPLPSAPERKRWPQLPRAQVQARVLGQRRQTQR
jgi:hypothetical protein